MVRVFHISKINSWLGGQMFRKGICDFEDNERGIKFAKKFYLKYAIISEDKPAEEPVSPVVEEKPEEPEEEKPAKKPRTKKAQVNE